jgi:hypothetical protein
MSIWTELLLFHGHVATPAALALFAPVGARTAAGPAAGRPSDPPAPDAARPAAPPTADRAAAPAAQVTVQASHPTRLTGSTSEPYCHPLRAVGQLR